MTTEYYDKNATEFCAATFPLDMSELRTRFLEHIPQGGRVLDAGCGSGRDALAFKDGGYEVVAFDVSEAIARIASANFGQEVLSLGFHEIAFESEFDGIWACASLLHVPLGDLAETFSTLGRALKSKAVLYASFKIGEGERKQVDGRFFVDLDETRLFQLLKQVPALEVVETWRTQDCRPERATEQWLNSLLKKTS